MRRRVAFAIPLLVAGTSLAPAAAAPSDARPAFHSLPRGTVSKVPEKASFPASIPAVEKADGFWLVANDGPGGGTRTVTVFPSAADAQEASRPGAAAFGRRIGTCYSEMRADQRAATSDADAAWPTDGQSRPMLFVQRAPSAAERAKIYGPLSPSTNVTAVHAERLIANDATARLEIADAWADPSTLGARPIGRTSVPLTRVAAGPAGVSVYAARDDRAVHFVVRGPRRLPSDDASAALIAQLVGSRLTVNAPDRTSLSDCDHVRVTLPATAGAGATATIETDAIVQVNTEDNPAPSAAAGFGLFGARGGKLQEVRVRPLRVHLSISQTSADAEPLVSVTFGWSGPSRTMSLPF